MLLFELIDVQRAAANGTLINNVPRSNLTPFSDFHPTISDSLINGLWFTSLSFSLATALFAVLIKQWIHQYVAVPSGTPRDRCRVRQFRYMGLQRWGVGFIIGLLPVLLTMSLGIFLVGLVLFLVPLQVTIASIVGAITFISFTAYFVSNFLPIIYPSCPYKTPLLQFIFPLYAYIAHNHFFSSAISSSSTNSKPCIHTLQGAEHSAVESSGEEMDTHALAWLFNMSSNPSVQTIVVESTGTLPLASVEPLKQHAKGILKMCRALSIFLLSPIEDEGRFDRLARAGLCLGNVHNSTWSDLLKLEKNQSSPEIYAELLAIYPKILCNSDDLEQVFNLLKAQLMRPADQLLLLQPIVWGSLFQKLLPLNSHSWDSVSSLIQPLFSVISPSYWHADYKPLPLFLGRDQLKICLTSDTIHENSYPVRLDTAIYEHLSPYVADAIFQYFRDASDSVFHSDSSNEFSALQDSRLHALLIMASLPSIQKVPITDSSIVSFFGKILVNISIYMNVYKFNLLDNNFPSFKLDDNHYSVLKLLYTLISSEEFSSASMRSLDQRITLVTFLRVLNSTCPHPCFLPKDWCTPFMASKFVQIAFQNKTQTLQDNNRQYWPLSFESASDELILYFLRFTPTVNLVFSHLVSECYLDQIGKLHGDDFFSNANNGYLPMILDTIIVQMTPDVLDQEIFQQSMAHIFEPKNLFTICAVHICRGLFKYLRHLAQVCPDHPAWPECLQKLNTISVAEIFGSHNNSPDWITHNISEFKEFVEGGCVGDFGLDMSDLQSPQQALGKDEHCINILSLVKSLWHWLQHHDTVAKTEEVMINPSGISEVYDNEQQSQSSPIWV